MYSTSIIISAFPGMGKTYSKKSITTLDIIDHESTPYRWTYDNDKNYINKRIKIHNPEFPKNYIDALKEIIYSEDSPDVVYVSSHSEVRDALNKEGIDYYLISPYYRCKESMIQRYRERGNSEKFCDQLYSNWNKYIDSINNETHPILIKFDDRNFIDVILLNDLLSRSRDMHENTNNFIKKANIDNLYPQQIFWSIVAKKKKFNAADIRLCSRWIDWDILCKFNKVPEEIILSSVYNNLINWRYLYKNAKKYSIKARKKIMELGADG